MNDKQARPTRRSRSTHDVQTIESSHLTKVEEALLKKFQTVVEKRAKNPPEAYPWRTEAGRLVKTMVDKKRTELQTSASRPPNLKAALWAMSRLVYDEEHTIAEYDRASRSEGVKDSVTASGAGTWKCNKFVADAYAGPDGGNVGVATRDSQKKGYPANKNANGVWAPEANVLAQDPLRNFTKPVKYDVASEPKNGDVLAFPATSGSGHAALYLGNGLLISAKEFGLEAESVKFESDHHAGEARVRVYVGKP